MDEATRRSQPPSDTALPFERRADGPPSSRLGFGSEVSLLLRERAGEMRGFSLVRARGRLGSVTTMCFAFFESQELC